MEEAKRILRDSEMPLITADDMDDAAQKAVTSLANWGRFLYNLDC